MSFKTLNSRLVYQNHWMRLREDEIERADGSKGLYGVVEKPDFVVVIPFDGEAFYLVSQFRYPIDRRALEFPQGAYDHDPGAAPERVARGELAEETGLRAGKLEHLGFSHASSGYATQGFHVFLATDLSQGPNALEAEEQDLEVHRMSAADFEAAILSGAITDAHTLAAYLYYKLGRPGAAA